MQEKFQDLLKNLDLSHTQIKIYLSVLNLGLCTVFDISKDTKINRPQIYLDTAILIEKGFLELAAKRYKKFLAVSPFKIVNLVKQKTAKLKELEAVLPEIGEYFESNKKDINEKFDIRIYEGLEGVKKAYNFELEEAEGSRIDFLIGDMDQLVNAVGRDYLNRWNKNYKNSGMKGRLIVDVNSKSLVYYKANYSSIGLETRGMENFLAKGHFEVWKDYVLIVSMGKTPKAVIIKNDILANTFKEIFEKMWKQST